MVTITLVILDVDGDYALIEQSHVQQNRALLGIDGQIAIVNADFENENHFRKVFDQRLLELFYQIFAWAAVTQPAWLNWEIQ